MNDNINNLYLYITLHNKGMTDRVRISGRDLFGGYSPPFHPLFTPFSGPFPVGFSFITHSFTAINTERSQKWPKTLV